MKKKDKDGDFKGYLPKEVRRAIPKQSKPKNIKLGFKLTRDDEY